MSDSVELGDDQLQLNRLVERRPSRLWRCRETSESTGVRGYPGGVRRERGVRNFALSLFGGGGFPVSIGLSITAA